MKKTSRRAVLKGVVVGGLAAAVAPTSSQAQGPPTLEARVLALEQRVTELETTAVGVRVDLETRLAAAQAEVTAIRAQVWSGVQLLQAILGMTP